MVGKKCSAPGCPVSSRSNPDEALISFPSDPQRFKRWCEAVGFDNKNKLVNILLCHRHFRASDFYDPGTRKRIIRRSNPIYPTGCLNPLTRDYSPAHEQVSTAPVHLQSCMDLGGQPSASLFHSANRVSHAADVLPLIGRGIEEREVDDQPTVHSVDSNKVSSITTAPGLIKESSSSSHSLLNSQEQLELGVSFLDSTHDDSSSQVGVGVRYESRSPGLEGSFSQSSGTKSADFPAPSPSTSYSENTPSCSIASRVAAQSINKLPILGKLGLSRLSQLTPLKVKLYEELKKTRKTLGAIRKSSARKSLQMQTSTSNAGNEVLLAKRFASSMSLPCANLMASQMRCFKRKPRGRRWTLGEKLMAVAMFKQSPSSYRFLRTLFVLPTPRTLTTMINKVPLKTGINAHIFEHLKKKIDSSDDVRYPFCSLIWDEMSIRELLGYSPSEDVIYGYEDLGDSRRYSRLAQHALVLSAVGLFYKWKQPLAFYFTSGCLESPTLVDIITSVLSQCTLAGLKVRVTVCDGHSVNRKAYQLLGSSPDKPYFTFEGVEVFTVFDPPHLLKCTRNMLAKHDLQFETEVELNGSKWVGLAKWSHIKEAAEEDKKSMVRMMRKLTPTHLEPTGASAMKVNLAAQVLSDTVAATIEIFVQFKVLPGEAMVTAQACTFFNKLFDSLNGFKSAPEGGGGLRCRMSTGRQSDFYEFWDLALTKLKKMKFVTKNGKTASTPTIQGWVRSINAVKLLWETLLKEVPGTTFLELRRINQDTLEHLFGSIRSKCGSNANPSASQFVSALKTCLLNGLVNSEFRGNCEAEHQPGELLNNLQQFLMSGLPVDTLQEEITSVHHDPTFIPPKTVVVIQDALGRKGLSAAYVTGFAVKRYLNQLECQRCSAGLLAARHDDYPSLTSISMREFSANKDALTYPSKEITVLFDSGLKIAHEILEADAYSPRPLQRVTNNLIRVLDFAWWDNHCLEHRQSVLDAMVLSLCRIYIPWWCKVRNQTMKADRKVALTRKLRILQHQ